MYDMATKVYKAAHTGSGHYGKIVKVINTDSAGVGVNALALHLGSTCIYKKIMAFDSSGITGYSISTSGDPQYLEPWSCILTPQSGHQALPWDTKVTMGGVDITSSVYDKVTGTISISSVTGDITIEAEAVMMSSEYEPVEYIKSPYPGTVASVVNLGYAPNNKTKLEIDANLADNGYPILLFGANNVNTAAPAVRFYQFQNIVANGGAMAWGPNRRATSAEARAGCGRRFNFVCDRGVFTFIHTNGDVNTIDISSDDEWKETANVRLFGAYAPSDRYYGSGTVWGIKISEIETVDEEEVQTWKRVYLPAKRRSDRCPGFYDQVSGNLFLEKPSWTLPGEETNTNATNNALPNVNTEEEEM